MKTIIERICASRPTLANGPVAISADELLGRAASLAIQLRAAGVVAGDIVVLVSSRSCEDIIGVLGILWSGAAFAVLEPGLLNLMEGRLQQLGARLIVAANDSIATALSLAREGLREIVAIPATSSHSLPQIVSGPSDPAYIVFTSGSTGKPKPIVVTHSNLLAYCDAVVERLGGAEVFRGKAAACVSSLSVDLGFTMVFPGLINGACLHVPPASVCVNADDFAEYNKQHAIDLLKITPFHLRALLQRPETLPREVLVLGGEHFDIQLLAAIKKHRLGLRVFNHYGPAETCVGVAAHRVDHLDPAELESDGLSSVPVGPPLRGVALRVVDHSGVELPPGTPGELVVFGPSVSHGYLGMEAETKARFRPTAEGICYQTGDWAVLRPNGSYVILGRLDRQIKIRGYRVDTVGVEAVLRSCPGVLDAAVGVRELGESGPSLVGWLIPTDQYSEAEVRDQLKRQLTAIECPVLLVTVDSFPQTPSGKLDFNRLPLPEIVMPKVDTGNRLELLLGIMTRVIGIQVHPSDNFLDLGGHSLAALRIIEHLRAQGIAMGLRDLYEARTVEALGACLTECSPCSQPQPGTLRESLERRATPYEEALWVASSLSGDEAYHLPVVTEFRGRIETEVILNAITKVLQRHHAFGLQVVEKDSLRMAYGSTRPGIQRISLVRSEDTTNSDDRAWDIVRDLWAKPLAPENGDSIRAAWIELENDRSWFVLIAHHIALDGPSLKIFDDELAALLEGACLEPISLADPNFALIDPKGRRHVPAWVHLEAPSKNQSFAKTREPRMVSRPLPSALPSLVARVARDLRVTPFSVVLAAWGIVGSWLQRSTRIAVATPADLRNYAEERTMGYKVNPIAIVIDSDPELPAAKVIKAVHESVAMELAHRRMPYAHHLQSRRALGWGASPITTMLTLERWPARVVRGCSLRRLPTPFPSVMFDLDLDIIEDDSGGWLIQLHGRGWEAEELDACLERFVLTLRKIIKHPDRAIKPLVYCSEDAPDSVLQFGKGATFNHTTERLHTRLVSRLEAEPDASRLIINEECLSLKQLDLRSRQWLTLIRSAGIRPGMVLAVDLEPGFEQLAAMLAIVRHGAIILALDRMWPVMRKHAVSAGVVAVLTDSTDYPNALSIKAETPIAEGRVDYACGQNDSAYIIGTSGSKGRPKLIQIAHGAIGNHFGWMRRVRPLCPEDRVLVWTTACFDVGMWERFAPLGEGATVVIASGLGARDLVRIAEIIVRNRITLFQTTPTLLRVLLENPILREVSWPIDVFCGGEFLNDELVASFRRVLPGSRLHNVYGPTEAAIDALAAFNVHRTGSGSFDHVVDNLDIRVVDGAGRSLGVGEVGELAISGPSLADGYVGDAEITASSFRALRPDDPTRFYLTGDLARWEAKGKLKLLGRADRQVKIQGERFELEEIENALLNSGSVREVAVIQENKRLAAFVVPAKNGVTTSDLVAHLSRSIPRTFVPKDWFLIESIPRTPSGKVDRKSLPQMRTNISKVPASEPSTPVQRNIAEIWRNVLGYKCSTDQNFFDAGGNSLLLLRLKSRLKEELGVEFTIPELFELTTIKAQASRVETTSTETMIYPEIPPDLLESGNDRHDMIAQLAAQRRS